MTPQEFCYWLQGYIEVADPKEISGKQLEAVKEHLQLVFTKVTGSQDTKKSIEDFLDGEVGRSKLCSGSLRTYC